MHWSAAARAHGSLLLIWSPARWGPTRVLWVSCKKRRAGRSPRAPRRQRSGTSAGRLLNLTQSTTRRRCGWRSAGPRGRPGAPDPGARADLSRAIELAGDVRTRARARIALSVVLFAAGEAARSIEILDAGLDEVTAEDPDMAERMEGHLLSNIEVAGPSLVRLPRTVGERVTRARAARKSRDTTAGRLVLCALAYEEFIGGGSASEVIRLADEALANDELLYVEGPAS